MCVCVCVCVCVWYSVPLSHIWRPSSHWSVSFIICMCKSSFLFSSPRAAGIVGRVGFCRLVQEPWLS